MEQLTETSFKSLIKEAIILGLQRRIAEDNEINVSTVARWANGISKPHPMLEDLIRERVLFMIKEIK